MMINIGSLTRGSLLLIIKGPHFLITPNLCMYVHQKCIFMCREKFGFLFEVGRGE